MSWTDREYKKRKEQEKLDRHTEICLENFYAVMGIAMARLGYEENSIMEVYQKMDEVYGIEKDFAKTCKEETGIEVVIT